MAETINNIIAISKLNKNDAWKLFFSLFPAKKSQSYQSQKNQQLSRYQNIIII